ncbi:MAG: hypothetical protein JEZ14_23055 [Marinilabiliaceae bacterium]|nr:hypothetical protein [Marinilabiliaceae bacterium]
MALTPINTLKEWFRRGLKPTQQQFWDWLDSFWHKDEPIPSASIDGLQGLLDAKVDKKDTVDPDQVGPYNPAAAYVFDAARAEYVSFSNADSAEPQFQVEGFYRLTENAPAGENPETHPGHWAYQGYTIGEITIDDVVDLREALNLLHNKPGANPNDKGWFETEAALTTNHPVGENGWYAIVGTTDTFWAWDSDTNAWKDSGSNQTPIAVDDTPTEGSNNPVSSDGVYQGLVSKSNANHEHTLSTIKPDANNANKMPVVSADGTLIGYTAFTFDQILQLASIDMTDINVGEKKIVLAEKASDGSSIMGGAIAQLDKLGAPGLTALLDETNPLWDGDQITITGNNRTGALGENSQEYRIGSDFFLCISHNNGTDASNGSATWVRNRGQDSLTPGVVHDDAIIAELETEIGWSSAGFKQITQKSKKGTWYRKNTGGYLFLCIDKNNGWSRIGPPSTADLEITISSHPTLTSNLAAHDFATNGMYDESSDGANETAEQGQEWWDLANNAWYKRNMNGRWAKMN